MKKQILLSLKRNKMAGVSSIMSNLLNTDYIIKNEVIGGAE